MRFFVLIYLQCFFSYINMPNKNLCNKCNKKHFPPTGKKCKYLKKGLVNSENDITVIPHRGVPV